VGDDSIYEMNELILSIIAIRECSTCADPPSHADLSWEVNESNVQMFIIIGTLHDSPKP
jgi:hypothetical protein